DEPFGSHTSLRSPPSVKTIPCFATRKDARARPDKLVLWLQQGGLVRAESCRKDALNVDWQRLPLSLTRGQGFPWHRSAGCSHPRETDPPRRPESEPPPVAYYRFLTALARTARAGRSDVFVLAGAGA